MEEGGARTPPSIALPAERREHPVLAPVTSEAEGRAHDDPRGRHVSREGGLPALMDRAGRRADTQAVMDGVRRAGRLLRAQCRRSVRMRGRGHHRRALLRASLLTAMSAAEAWRQHTAYHGLRGLQVAHHRLGRTVDLMRRAADLRAYRREGLIHRRADEAAR